MKPVPKKTVLCVDDDEVNQLVISSFLEGEDNNIVQVYSREECLDYLQNAVRNLSIMTSFWLESNPTFVSMTCERLRSSSSVD